MSMRSPRGELQTAENQIDHLRSEMKSKDKEIERLRVANTNAKDQLWQAQANLAFLLGYFSPENDSNDPVNRRSIRERVLNTESSVMSAFQELAFTR